MATLNKIVDNNNYFHGGFMCWREAHTWEEPGVEVTCGDAIESYEKLTTATEEFEPILKMVYGKEPFDREFFMQCIDELAQTLGIKSYNADIVLGVVNA